MRDLKKGIKQKVNRYSRRKHRVNFKIKKFSDNPRVILNKSNMFLKAQVVDVN